MDSSSSLKLKENEVAESKIEIIYAIKNVISIIQSFMYILLGVCIFCITVANVYKTLIAIFFIMNAIFNLIKKEKISKINIIESALNVVVAIICIVRHHDLENIFPVVFAFYIAASVIIQSTILVFSDTKEENDETQMIVITKKEKIERLNTIIANSMLYALLAVLLITPILGININAILAGMYFLLTGTIYFAFHGVCLILR